MMVFTGVSGLAEEIDAVDAVVPFEHVASMAARVFGPTTPQPVVRGVPEETMPCSFCHCLAAASVVGPK
jgi:hypothetical protein